MLLNVSPDAYLFPTERNTPLSRDNLWNRQMRPKLETVGLEWATFQVLRRTNASLSRKAKIDDKVSADQRGHGLGVSMEVYSHSDHLVVQVLDFGVLPGVSMEVYSHSDLEQKSEAVKRLESEVIQ